MNYRKNTRIKASIFIFPLRKKSKDYTISFKAKRMNKLGNFLWKLFSITMVLSWNAKGVAVAADEDTNWGVYSHGSKGKTMTICPAGEYVYSCGSYKVGYNWLRSITLTAPNSTERTINNYDIGDDTYAKMTQLHAFFNRAETIKYKDISDPDKIQTISSSDNIVMADKEFILGLVCNPLNNTKITCVACPDGGTVEETNVKVGKDAAYEETDLLLIRNSWNFHTIADCYVTEFTDASGSFVYASPTVSTNNEKGEACYYVNTNSNDKKLLTGDILYGFVFTGQQD